VWVLFRRDRPQPQAYEVVSCWHRLDGKEFLDLLCGIISLKERRLVARHWVLMLHTMDGQVRLVHLVRLQMDNSCLFLPQQTDKRQTTYCLHHEQTENGLRTIVWASVFRLPFETAALHIYIYSSVSHIYIYMYGEIAAYISVCIYEYICFRDGTSLSAVL
jgi:hypothetical protein